MAIPRQPHIHSATPPVDMTMTADLIPEAEARLAAYGELFDKTDNVPS